VSAGPDVTKEPSCAEKLLSRVVCRLTPNHGEQMVNKAAQVEGCAVGTVVGKLVCRWESEGYGRVSCVSWVSSVLSVYI
jgi:hypothetical protein